MYSSCRVTCHCCGHVWIYMGIFLASLGHSRKPVKIKCPRCRVHVAMEAKEAR